MSALALVPQPREDAPDAEWLDWLKIRERAIEELGQATEDLDLPLGSYLHWPWASLDAVIGGVSPGRLWYVCIPSGFGKTTLMASFCEAALAKGERVYCMPLEGSPKEWRVHLAARRLGYDPGDILTGAFKTWPDADTVRRRMRTEYERIADHDHEWSSLAISRATGFSSATIEAAFLEARNFDADWVIVDHVDHLAEDGRKSEWQVSFHGNKRMSDLTKEYGLRTVATSQLTERKGEGDPLKVHRIPTEDLVRFGGHKKQLADGMLGGCWPLRIAPPLSREEIQAYRDRTITVRQICEPMTLLLGVMKHRQLGRNYSERVYLGIEHGKVVDRSQDLYRVSRYP